MNPFIRLLTDPIHTLTLTGYTLLMLTIALAGTTYILREGTTLIVLATREHRRGSGPHGEWWGDYADGWIPPTGWILRFAKTAFVGVLMLWALATVVYITA